MWDIFKRQILEKVPVLPIFWPFVLPNFFSFGSNDLKFSYKLLLNELTRYLRIMIIADILHLWQSSKETVFKVFKPNLSPEIDVITKIWWDSWHLELSRRFKNLLAEAAIQRCSKVTMFWKYAANLQQNTHAEVRLFSEHLFLGTPLGGYFCTW